MRYGDPVQPDIELRRSAVHCIANLCLRWAASFLLVDYILLMQNEDKSFQEFDLNWLGLGLRSYWHCFKGRNYFIDSRLSFSRPVYFCSVEHKRRDFVEGGKQSSFGALLTTIVVLFSYYGSQYRPRTVFPNISHLYRFGTT